MNLLVFFAIPIATIILSGILETFINSPFKVTGIFFSIFLVTAFALGGTADLIVAAIIYTIISFITAYLVMLLTNKQKHCYNNCDYSNYNGYNNYNSFQPASFGFNGDHVINSLPENDNNSFNFNNSNNDYRYR